MPFIAVGAGISIGAGLGLVIGMLFGDTMFGMIAGAGIGPAALLDGATESYPDLRFETRLP